jgi:hypothetical protein
VRRSSPTIGGLVRWIPASLLVLAIVVAGLVLGFFMEDESTTTPMSSDPVAHVTLDEVGCAYEGDDTPKAPYFYLGMNNLTSNFSHVEVNRVPADVATDDVERFFELQQALLEHGEAFRGLPEEWRPNRGGGLAAATTGAMLVGDPTFPDQMLVAGQRYVVWCSTGEPPTRVFFAKVVEPTE